MYCFNAVGGWVLFNCGAWWGAPNWTDLATEQIVTKQKKTEIIHRYMQMPTNYNTFRKIIYDNGIYDFS